MTESLTLEGMATGEAIREYLLTVKRGNPYGFYKLFRQVKGVTSYHAVRNYFWILKEILLIRPVGTEPSKRGFKKHMYEIVPGKEEDPAWWHPQMELYPDTKLGRRGYAKMEARGLKPRGGRARKYA